MQEIYLNQIQSAQQNFGENVVATVLRFIFFQQKLPHYYRNYSKLTFLVLRVWPANSWGRGGVKGLADASVNNANVFYVPH